MMTLYIVRHGQTEENLQRILQGHIPGTLTEKGKEEVREAAELLSKEGVKFTRIVSSDLKRAMDSANIISERLHLPVASGTDEFFFRDLKRHFLYGKLSEDLGPSDSLASGRQAIRIPPDRFRDIGISFEFDLVEYRKLFAVGLVFPDGLLAGWAEFVVAHLQDDLGEVVDLPLEILYGVLL